MTGSADSPACCSPQRGGADVIDAAVVLLSVDGDEIFTSDPAGLRDVAGAAGRQVDLIPV